MKVAVDMRIEVDDEDAEKEKIAMDLVRDEAHEFGNALRRRFEQHGVRVDEFSLGGPKE